MVSDGVAHLCTAGKDRPFIASDFPAGLHPKKSPLLPGEKAFALNSSAHMCSAGEPPAGVVRAIYGQLTTELGMDTQRVSRESLRSFLRTHDPMISRDEFGYKYVPEAV